MCNTVLVTMINYIVTVSIERGSSVELLVLAGPLLV